MQPLISICIPAYKRQDFLNRLLQSIATQTFRDFEVVVTDDSSDNSVAELVQQYQTSFTIRYHKNPVALGTPANWNAGIKLATGTWIKVMHDDDWFSRPDSLQLFADATTQTSSHFIFSSYYDVVLETGHRTLHQLSSWRSYLLRQSPYNILSRNVIGHPSTTLIRNAPHNWYNERLKWVVDIEFYIRMLQQQEGQFHAIPQPLVCLGISNEQVTKAVFRKPEVEIPENICLLNIITPAALKPIMAYDYYWRFLRNLQVRDMTFIDRYRQEYPVPPIVNQLVRHQQRIPVALLRIGIFSKLAMLLSYISVRLRGRLR